MDPVKPLVLFDGVCNYCNYWVRFIIKRDKKKKLLFTPLQGKTAETLLPKYGIDTSKLNSVVFIENGKAYIKSTASLRITRYLSGGWKVLYPFLIFPRFLRDAVYNLISNYRYKWFGKKRNVWCRPLTGRIDSLIKSRESGDGGPETRQLI